ncbi:MAG: c-type cytochrome [Bryobacteraceae bacterium]
MKPACVLPCLIALVAGLAPAQSANPFAGNTKGVEVGRGMFRIYCAACHGIQARGGRGPDLTRGVYNSGDQDSDLFRTISQGIAGTEMGSFADALQPDNIWRIVAFIRSVSNSGVGAPVTGDPERGEALFWGKGACGQCHTVNARGGRFGPDLSRAGRQRSYAYLRSSIVEPNLDIADGYHTLTVVTPDGRTITGIERGLDNFTAQLSDASGKFYSFDKSQVGSVRRETRSLMPDNYGAVLSAAEIDDLLAYLSGLHGEARKP